MPNDVKTDLASSKIKYDEFQKYASQANADGECFGSFWRM